MTETPLTIVLAIPPYAQPLDVSGPLAAFREANRQAHAALYDVRVMSTVKSKLIDIDGMAISAHATIYGADVPMDTLLVAGTYAYEQAFDMEDLQQWLQRQAPTCRRYGSVCTGAFFLGVAGLIDGVRVTTHWQQADELTKRFPKADVYADSIYVQDGPVCTSAGVTAGIDLSLKLIEDDYGRDLALKVARRLVVFLRRPGGQSQFSAHLAAQTSDSRPIQAVQQWVLDNLSANLSVPRLAGQAAMSVRNFSRVFHDETGSTPADFVERVRVDAAKRLLEDSDKALQRIAMDCGFTNVDLMRRAFIRRLGINPSDYRSRFSR